MILRSSNNFSYSHARCMNASVRNDKIENLKFELLEMLSSLMSAHRHEYVKKFKSEEHNFFLLFEPVSRMGYSDVISSMHEHESTHWELHAQDGLAATDEIYGDDCQARIHHADCDNSNEDQWAQEMMPTRNTYLAQN